MFETKWINRLKKTFENRNLFSKYSFIDELVLKGYSQLQIEIVYDKIFDYLPKKIDKPLYPSDNVILDYDIDDEDLGDIMIEIFEKLNLRFPSTTHQAEFYTIYGDEITMEKMILFVDFFSKKLLSPPQ